MTLSMVRYLGSASSASASKYSSASGGGDTNFGAGGGGSSGAGVLGVAGVGAGERPTGVLEPGIGVQVPRAGSMVYCSSPSSSVCYSMAKSAAAPKSSLSQVQVAGSLKTASRDTTARHDAGL